jgi:cytochrome oxidase assembly protein ShyY1
MPSKPQKTLVKFLVFSLLVLVTEVVILNLALWQKGRMEEKQQLIRHIDAQLGKSTVTFNPQIKLSELQKITLIGEFDYSRTYYLENVTHLKKRGRKVIVPFVTEDGTEFLIALGWINDKTVIKKQPRPSKITGIVREFPSRKGWLQGPTEGIEKNSLMFFDPVGIKRKAGIKRANFWLEMSQSIHAEVRSFSDVKPYLTPERHQQYMITWSTLFVILGLMYVYYCLIFWRKQPSSHTEK